MKIRPILCLSVAFVIPQLAAAKLPFSVDSLAKMEGILDFCAKVDTQAAAKYQEREKLIAGDASKEELADARKTQEYKDAYQEISDKLAKAPTESAAKACIAYLGSGK